MPDAAVATDGKLLPPGDPLFAEVYDFLLTEAELVDGGRLQEWLALLAEDVSYRMPLRLNVRHNSDQPRFSEQSELFSDNLASLTTRVNKLGTDYAWAETPASRTRHFVSNIRVRTTARPDELDVTSYLLLYRNQGSRPHADVFSGERRDLLRNLDGAWRLARRTILLDQAVLDGGHMAIFF